MPGKPLPMILGQPAFPADVRTATARGVALPPWAMIDDPPAPRENRRNWWRLLPGWLLSLTLHGLFALTLTTIVTVNSQTMNSSGRGTVAFAGEDGSGGDGSRDMLGLAGGGETSGLDRAGTSTVLPTESASGWKHFRTTPAELNAALAGAVKELASSGTGFAGGGLTGGGQGQGSGHSGSGGSGNGQGGGGQGVGFFGTQGMARTCVYVVDMSGSMHGRRFHRALSELNRSIGALRPAQQFFVILFSDYAVPLFSENSLASLDSSHRLAMIPATLTNKQRTQTWLRKMIADGQTYPAGALKMALDMHPDVVFFLTDGEIPEDVPGTISSYNTGHVTIHTIGFENVAGELLLRRLASDNHGTYRYVR